MVRPRNCITLVLYTHSLAGSSLRSSVAMVDDNDDDDDDDEDGMKI